MVETNGNVRKAPSFDRLAAELRLHELEQSLSDRESEEEAAFQGAESRFAPNASDKAERERLPDEHARRYALFKLLVHEKEGKLRWQALKDKNSGKRWDTDAEVLKLWQKLDPDPDLDFISTKLADCHWSVTYHRLWLFEWFLRRYDVRRAREVVGDKSINIWTQNAHIVLFVAVLAVFGLRRIPWLGANETLEVFGLCVVAYAAALIPLALSFWERLSDKLEPLAVATHSLIPRLAGAGAVGLVILSSSQELLKVVVDAKPLWLLGLLLAGYGYLLLEMARRIHPMPRARRLLLHAFDVATTAFAHSMTLVLLAEGGLRRVHDGSPGDLFTGRQAFSIVVFVFTIGLVVNLIWAEQPVTEPL